MGSLTAFWAPTLLEMKLAALILTIMGCNGLFYVHIPHRKMTVTVRISTFEDIKCQLTQAAVCIELHHFFAFLLLL